MTRLAVFFDGTWNTPTDRTNVANLHELLESGDPAQRGTYIQGVGTSAGGLLGSFWNALGGAFGDGLSDNICAGYRWLAQSYQPGDQLYLLGFSRGAYTVRCVAGVLKYCGVPTAVSDGRGRALPCHPRRSGFRRRLRVAGA